MKKSFRLSLLFLACCVATAHAQFQTTVSRWHEFPAATVIGSAAAEGQATASAPVVAAEPDGTRCLAFEFGFAPKKPPNLLEAEEARSQGVTKYADMAAWGGYALGEFGEKVGDYVEFTVPQTDGVNVHYNNGTGSTKQAGLYINGTRVATLQFEDTGGWFTPFRTVSYRGAIGETVRVQVDAEDLAANKVFCCNIDALSYGIAPERKEAFVEAGIPLSVSSIERSVQTISLCFRATDSPFTFAVEDADGAFHTTVQWRPPGQHRMSFDDEWERCTVLAMDFEPPLTPELLVRGLKSMCIRIAGTEKTVRGRFAMKDLLVADGWPSTPPRGCPVEPSQDCMGIRFTGRRSLYTRADTWYPSWASDDKLYSPYTDGFVGEEFVRSDNAEATTGMAIVEGDDPLRLEITNLGSYRSRPWPFATRYPCGTLVHNGVWYYGTYILNGDGRPNGENTMLGPFVGFRTSRDFGKTWTETPCTPLRNLFGEFVDAIPDGYNRIRMGSPHFVDFGRNMEHSPDGKAYLLAHGGTHPTAGQTWILGDNLYLVRVAPSPEHINDQSKYEFFAGHDASGQPVWSHSFADIRPLLTWPGRTGCVTATYIPPLKRYLMCVSVGRSVNSTFDTYVLESSQLTGPWRLVTYMSQFGTQAYFVNIPSKFIAKDGRTMWFCYAANWTGHAASPKGAGYAMSLQEFTLLAE